MAQSAFRARRGRLVVLAAVAALAVLVGVGVYGLITGPSAPPETPGHTTTQATTPAGTPGPAGRARRVDDLPQLPDTDDPVRYARAVAYTVFTWDTLSGLSPRDYMRPILTEADPSGVESAGLASDLGAYLPSEQAWRQLREYETRQWIDVDAAAVPASWADIAAEAGEQIREGTVAVTIEGTRHREGVWLDEIHTSAHPVAFTVFLACQPTWERCHPLRLSALDTPLR